MNKTSLFVSAAPILLVVAATLAAQERDRSKVWEAMRARYDTNLDGKISPEEFTRGPAAFRRLDRNHDGFLTAEDFEGPNPPPSKAKAPAVAPAPEHAATDEDLRFFESHIRPVLSSSCFECHSASAKKIKGGLRLDSREAMLAGGTTGPVIVPGNADESLLVQAVRYTNEDLQMPPKKQLADDVIKDFEHWISIGAPWPITNGIASPADKPAATSEKHVIDFGKARLSWPFKMPERLAPPATKDKHWAWSDIDRFLLASMEANGVAPVADADKRAWLRRATFDLTGLPPSPEELDSFEKDRSNEAYAKVIDRLLASPAYGERFGRHWLDVARYAESSGKDSNVLYPHAWRYRDWVIAAFNADMPYDQFLREQLAGDLLPAANDDERAQHEIATGYLAIGAKSHNSRDRRQFALDVVDEQIDAVSEGMLGLTVACARCHDHKFDPIPTRDYYALAGIFMSSDTRYGTMRGLGNNQPAELIELPKGARVPNGPTMDRRLRTVLEKTRDRIESLVDEGMKQQGTGGDGMMAGKKDEPGEGKKKKGADGEALVRLRITRDQAALLDDLLGRFDANGRALDSNRLAMGVVEGKPHDIAVLDRGELDKPGPVAKRGVPEVLCENTPPVIARGSGRKELADFIASKDNPLTARVWANRIWLHLFGRGIVSTPDNFGASGAKPDHLELLDWLATELVQDDWSTKKLVREIVLSHAYRLASSDDPRCSKIDPEAINVWRMPKRRLEAEAIRDSMLSAAGILQKDPPVGSSVGTLEGTAQREDLLKAALTDEPVRSVYMPLLRDHMPEALEVFDGPDGAFVTGDRDETNVATQALYLMNDESVLKTADAFAARIIAHEKSDEDRVAYAFELAFGRKPSGTESGAVREFLHDFEKRLAKDGREPSDDRDPRGKRDKKKGEAQAIEPARANTDPVHSAWAAVALSLFQSAEFRYLD